MLETLVIFKSWISFNRVLNNQAQTVKLVGLILNYESDTCKFDSWCLCESEAWCNSHKKFSSLSLSTLRLIAAASWLNSVPGEKRKKTSGTRVIKDSKLVQRTLHKQPQFYMHFCYCSIQN